MKGNKSYKRFKNRFIFFGRNSVIHGLNHLFRPKISLVSRLFWLIAILASLGCVCIMMLHEDELNVKINYTPDTRYLHWTTTFPALTVCEKHNTKQALKKFTSLYPDLLSPLDYDYRRYLTDMLYVTVECSKAQCLPCGKTVPCVVPWRSIIDKVRKSCEDILAECSYNQVPFPCCQYFRTVDSEYGTCYSFNTMQHTPQERLFVVNRTTGPGLLTFRLKTDAAISVHSPEELSTNNLDIKLIHILHPYAENYVDLLFSIVEIANDQQLFKQDVEVRGCRFLEEIPKGMFHTYPVYSYGACRLAHSTEETYRRCGCIHPARDLSYKNYYCNYTGINCWNTYEEHKKRILNDVGDDPCLPSCVESELTTIHIVGRRDPDRPPGIQVNVQMVSLPTLRYQRDLIKDNLDLVVTVGGLVGLFFSFSILGLLEIFYLILRPQSFM